MALKIAIVGAGPAGCSLARLLYQSKKGLDVTIFESEKSMNLRSQGGTLDLRSNSGLAVMRAAGLWEEFSKDARYDGEALQVTDKNYLCYISISGSKGEHKDLARPEIDRPALRKLLFESLPEGSVRWGKKLKEVDSNNVLHFQDGTSESGFDLIVGADGAWSKTRPRISPDKPFYSGISGYQLSIPNAEQNHKDLYDRVNRGSIFSYASQKAIMAQQMGDGTIVAGIWITQPKDWQKTVGHDVYSTKDVVEHCSKEFADWNPRLLAFTQQLDSVVAPRDLYMLPIGNSWNHSRGVTLIGDAAHLATPFAGQGVNEALVDALKLSRAIISAIDEEDKQAALDRNVQAFEKDMFIRGKAMQTAANTNMQLMFVDPNAPRNGIEKFILSAAAIEMGIFAWLLAPIVYGYFFFFKLWHRV